MPLNYFHQQFEKVVYTAQQVARVVEKHDDSTITSQSLEDVLDDIAGADTPLSMTLVALSLTARKQVLLWLLGGRKSELVDVLSQTHCKGLELFIRNGRHYWIEMPYNSGKIEVCDSFSEFSKLIKSCLVEVSKDKSSNHHDEHLNENRTLRLGLPAHNGIASMNLNVYCQTEDSDESIPISSCTNLVILSGEQTLPSSHMSWSHDRRLTSQDIVLWPLMAPLDVLNQGKAVSNLTSVIDEYHLKASSNHDNSPQVNSERPKQALLWHESLPNADHYLDHTDFDVCFQAIGHFPALLTDRDGVLRLALITHHSSLKLQDQIESLVDEHYRIMGKLNERLEELTVDRVSSVQTPSSDEVNMCESTPVDRRDNYEFQNHLRGFILSLEESLPNRFESISNEVKVSELLSDKISNLSVKDVDLIFESHRTLVLPSSKFLMQCSRGLQDAFQPNISKEIAVINDSLQSLEEEMKLFEDKTEVFSNRLEQEQPDQETDKQKSEACLSRWNTHKFSTESITPATLFDDKIHLESKVPGFWQWLLRAPGNQWRWFVFFICFTGLIGSVFFWPTTMALSVASVCSFLIGGGLFFMRWRSLKNTYLYQELPNLKTLLTESICRIQGRVMHRYESAIDENLEKTRHEIEGFLSNIGPSVSESDDSLSTDSYLKHTDWDEEQTLIVQSLNQLQMQQHGLIQAQQQSKQLSKQALLWVKQELATKRQSTVSSIMNHDDVNEDSSSNERAPA